MPVTIREIVKIRDIDGKEFEGQALATNLVCIQSGEDQYYGIPIGMVRVETTVVCDNEDCVNSEVDDKFVTHPKTIEFTEGGSEDPKFIKELSEVLITADYKGEKQVFCSKECYQSFLRRTKRNVVEFPAGKGKKTEFAIK